jgi:hypothetical protein
MAEGDSWWRRIVRRSLRAWSSLTCPHAFDDQGYEREWRHMARSIDRYHRAVPELHFPRLARAWEFYYREPLRFRHYVDGRQLMGRFLEELGLDVPIDVLNVGGDGMRPYWVQAEAALAERGAHFEAWAAPYL